MVTNQQTQKRDFDFPQFKAPSMESPAILHLYYHEEVLNRTVVGKMFGCRKIADAIEHFKEAKYHHRELEPLWTRYQELAGRLIRIQIESLTSSWNKNRYDERMGFWLEAMIDLADLAEIEESERIVSSCMSWLEEWDRYERVGYNEKAPEGARFSKYSKTHWVMKVD